MAHIRNRGEDFWGAQITEVFDDLAQSEMSHETPTQVVYELGDVVLVADDGIHPAQKMKVSTVVLSVASKVFKALFSGGFAEAEAIRNSVHDAVEIRISDHPSDALLLCQLLHFQGNLEKLSYERFLGLAVVIDKYDCVEALRHVVYAKFAALNLDNFDQREHLYYATAAWVLDQPRFFRELTKDLVIHYTSGPYEMTESSLDIFPPEVLASIRSQRSFVGQELTYHLSKFIAKYHTAAFFLGCPAHSNELTQSMLAHDLWPLDLGQGDYNTLHCLFFKLNQYHVPVMQVDKVRFTEVKAEATGSSSSQNILSDFAARGQAVEPPTKLELNNILERIELFCVGLCLDCCKGKDTCRVPHSDPFDHDLLIAPRSMGMNGGPDRGAGTERLESWESIW